jgi:hypothetical protein
MDAIGLTVEAIHDRLGCRTASAEIARAEVRPLCERA